MNKDQIKEYRALKSNGIDVSKHNQIKPNAGSETFAHLLAKTAVAHLGVCNGYRVDSEVEFPEGKEADILLWGHEDRFTVVVECQTGWTQGDVERKLGHYKRGLSAIDDLYKVEVNRLPENWMDALVDVGKQIGLDP